MTWAVVQCQPRQEQLVLTLVKIAVFKDVEEIYLPRIRIRKRISPLFPGYVFVRLVDRWYSIATLPGVIRLLMAGDRPARIADEIIQQIRSRERNGLVKLPQAPRLRRGQPVRVVRG